MTTRQIILAVIVWVSLQCVVPLVLNSLERQYQTNIDRFVTRFGRFTVRLFLHALQFLMVVLLLPAFIVFTRFGPTSVTLRKYPWEVWKSSTPPEYQKRFVPRLTALLFLLGRRDLPDALYSRPFDAEDWRTVWLLFLWSLMFALYLLIETIVNLRVA